MGGVTSGAGVGTALGVGVGALVGDGVGTTAVQVDDAGISL